MYDELASITLSLKRLEEANWSALAEKSCIVIAAGLQTDLAAFGLDESLKQYVQESDVIKELVGIVRKK